MNAYVDSSVLLRVVLGEPGRLKTWLQIRNPLSSDLIKVECLRTIDRARIRANLHDEEVAHHRAALIDAIDSFQLVAIDKPILDRAAEPFPTLLGSLDAIHLASALLAREQFDSLVLATHDEELALAARSVGLTVYGA